MQVFHIALYDAIQNIRAHRRVVRVLNNPALGETDTNRDGVRQYLKARMPSFSFSDGEIRKIVRFLEALSWQAQPFIAEKLEPLTDAERTK